MNQYLFYDLRGVQQFIFAIPRLRYIVGGSRLVDRFDRTVVPKLDGEAGARYLYSGGGHGALLCPDDAAADRVQDRLRLSAREIGADLAIGRSSDFNEAAHCADRLFSYLPEEDDLDGHPCPASGLYPVETGPAHKVVTRRRFSRGVREERKYELELLNGSDEDREPKKRLVLPGYPEDERDFFHDVSPDGEAVDPDADDDTRDVARKAARALGSRNRWAVIAMDGNGMGRQFAAHKGLPDDELTTWLENSSRRLDDATRLACHDALQEVVNRWADEETVASARLEDGTVVLPVRPLVVGGDDLIVLCHVAHAFTFVKAACETFATKARADSDVWAKHYQRPLWPASDGRLTISAGVLFAPVSLPLSTAIQYAESLLASAKRRGREIDQTAPPACVDWQSVTAGVVDHPAATRQRGWRFDDRDIGEYVSLTRRPYAVSQLDRLQALAAAYGELPTSLLHDAYRELRRAYWDRRLWRVRLGKRHSALARDLEEPETWSDGPAHGRWQRTRVGDRWERHTDVVDALDLVIEANRMARETAEARR